MVVDKEYITKESNELINQIKGRSIMNENEKIVLDFGSIKRSSLITQSSFTSNNIGNNEFGGLDATTKV